MPPPVTESQHEYFEDRDPDPGAQLMNAQIGLRGPGFPDNQYWAGLSGLAKDLKKLPVDVRLSLVTSPKQNASPPSSTPVRPPASTFTSCSPCRTTKSTTPNASPPSPSCSPTSTPIQK